MAARAGLIRPRDTETPNASGYRRSYRLAASALRHGSGPPSPHRAGQDGWLFPGVVGRHARGRFVGESGRCLLVGLATQARYAVGPARLSGRFPRGALGRGPARPPAAGVPGRLPPPAKHPPVDRRPVRSHRKSLAHGKRPLGCHPNYLRGFVYSREVRDLAGRYKYVVPGIIVEGLTLLCAKPKVGKSWLLLHAAIAVARGGFTLGNIHCPQGDVLCCALEDSMRRVQSRLTRLLGMPPWPGEDHMHVRCEMPRLGAGGLDVIKDWITKAKNPRLVVIDTLAMIRAPRNAIKASMKRTTIWF